MFGKVEPLSWELLSEKVAGVSNLLSCKRGSILTHTAVRLAAEVSFEEGPPISE